MTPDPQRPPGASTSLAAGVVRLEGRDALRVLHDISTQSLLDLAPGAARLALFCDFRGRVLHRAVVAGALDGAVWLVREDAPGATLAAHIERSVFRADTRVQDASTWLTVTPQAAGVGLAPGATTEIDDRPERIQAPGAPGYVLAAPAGGVGAERQGADAEKWETSRIELGWAAHGHEVCDEFNPFEVNLGQGVHLDKGCFTGQEALMRLITYRSLRRRLVRLEGVGAPQPPAQVMGANRTPVGRLTTLRSEGRRWTGLAVLRNDACRPGAELEVEGATSARVANVFPLHAPLGRPLEP